MNDTGSYRARRSMLMGLLLWAVTFSHGIAEIEVVQSWVRRYDGQSRMHDLPAELKVNSRGDIFITGASYNQTNSDICTIKYDGRTGALLWEKVYDGPAKGNDAPHSMVIDGADNVLVAGRSDDGTAKSAYLAKYNGANGTVLWEWRGTGSGLQVTVDSKGDVFCLRATTATDGFTSSKHAAADGRLIWETNYFGPTGSHAALCIVVDRDGDALISGKSGGDFFTAKYAGENGSQLWVKRDAGLCASLRMNGASVIAADNSSDIVLSGWSYTCGMGTPEGVPLYYTAKYSAKDGTTLWSQTAGWFGLSYARALTLTKNGDAAVTGVSEGGFYTVKYAHDGSFLWERRLPTPIGMGNDGGAALSADAEGNVVVTGWMHNARGDADYYTAQYRAVDGALLWEASFDGSDRDPYSGDQANNVAMDAAGNVIVTGTSSNGTNTDFLTIKYTIVERPMVMLQVLGNADTRISFTGTPGLSYSVQRSSAASGPFWAIGTASVNADRSAEFIDLTAPSVGAFYRVSYP